MSAFVMLFVVIATAGFRLNVVYGMKVLDIGSIHDNRGHRATEYRSVEKEKNYDDFMRKKQNIIRSPLIEITGYKDNDIIDNRKNKGGSNKYGRYQLWPWRQYLYVKPPWLKRVFTPRKLNYPVDDAKKRVPNENLREYSKIYLVLDQNANLAESDISDMNNLVSSVLFKSKAGKESTVTDHVQKEHRYKGFVLRDNRRRIRESKEMVAPTDSVERNHKQKRDRGDYGGGGGRTAIPYIRHRGDIFERE